MSIRIHELAKRHNMEGKEMLTLLKERGYVSADTKSVSSTVSNIYVEEIEKELAAKAPVGTPPAAEPSPAASSHAAEPGEEVEEMIPTVRPPTGAFVRTKEEVVREREATAAAKVASPSTIGAPSALRPSMQPPARPAPAMPRHVSEPVTPPKPGPVAPPPPPITTKAPPPLAPPPLPRAAPLPPPPLPGMNPVPVTASAGITTSATITQHGEHGEIKIIHIKPPIVVRDFASALGLKPFRLISELNQAGGFASMNSNIEEAVAIKVAEKHGFLLEIKHRGDATQQQAKKEKKPVEEDESKFLVPRPPVVCILGHVDHGKTTLLDVIRKADVAAGEAGGITQHIGAYQIEFQGRKITFLDTPGHAAFSKMRARGANVTDIAILVVAADDGFMPQTEEALKYAQNAKVALIVAVNKMDVKGANLDQVKAQMQQRGIAPEDWGGETITVPVAALKGQGIDHLLEMILLQADVIELRANPKAEAQGVVIESQIDVGRGPLTTVIVQRGTLRVGDALVCGPHYARVRAMFDDQGNSIKEATPATPARVIGWSGTPDSGAQFRAVKNAREAEKLAEEEQQNLRKAATTTDALPKDVSVEQLFANIAATQAKVLKVIIKTDVFGSAEAVRAVLDGIKSTKASLEIVSADVGLVTKNDVLMASAAGAVIVGFNTKLENGVTPLAKHHGVQIEMFSIIYELGDRVRDMLADLLEPELRETKTGAAEVRQVFPLAKGFVAGCLVTEGKIIRNGAARLRRGREIVHEGKIATLKRFKDDANEVRAGLECGVKLDDFNAYENGDVIEVYEIQKVRASL